MRMINKFGGEILNNFSLVKLALKWINQQIAKNQKPLVVVSALARVTDKLLQLTQTFNEKLLEELDKQHQNWAQRFKLDSPKLKKETEELKVQLRKDLFGLKKAKDKLIFQDKILAYGEKWSALLFTEFLIKDGILAKKLTGEELGVITDENFGDANIDKKKSLKNIRAKLKNISQVPVITGFIGRTQEGRTTTLGRGGSDTTACLVGAALNPSKVILWKNVPGVLSAEPKIVKSPKLIKFLSYEEAEEAGKVIHYKAIDLAREGKVEIEVVFIQDPSKKTIINKNQSQKKRVKIINAKKKLNLFIIKGEKITKPGALYEIAKIISQAKINMVLIRNTKESLYIVVEKNSHNLTNCQKKIENLGYQVLAKEVAMVNAVGSMNWKVVERFNRLLYEDCPEMDLGAFPYKNCHRLEAIVERPKVNKLIKAFHKEFIEI